MGLPSLMPTLPDPSLPTRGTRTQVLDVSDNRIQSLPENIHLMRHLTTLTLVNNKIKRLPDGLQPPYACVLLRPLILDGNPIVEPPSELGADGVGEREEEEEEEDDSGSEGEEDGDDEEEEEEEGQG